jgi:endonuclease YncB( thermonuclease family)
MAFVFQFPAIIDDWHDGDTCHVHRTALPGMIIHGESVRIEGMNAPELKALGGAASLEFAKQIAPPGTKVTLVISREDKFGRLLARIILPDGQDFTTLMIVNGQAVAA